MNTVMRHDIPDIGTMSEAYPHLIFHNFSSRLGLRVCNILKYLFPVPKPESKRILSFVNSEDFISFRHHTFKKNAEQGNPDNHIELKEVGPRFEMKLYQIKLGTLEIENTSETEWVLRPFMNTAKKRKFLSKD
jgi:U3 small nucleolar ribonucleoprotein protein IMP4